ncbi:hypothetical protein DFH09DRAFT_1253099 [Mycena vulgaris]|nr:hypothetical protein DFH09DRAFT_1253099 [Mycena vulgaris]
MPQLLREYDVDGANAYELLSYEDEDGDGDGDGDGDDAESGSDDESEAALTQSAHRPRRHIASGDHEEFRIGVRVDAVRRAEGNRRAGGLKTQKAMVRAWNEFLGIARVKNEIRDDIVDELSLLLYIKFNAEREKRTRKGVPIPGTHLGASQMKKQFFGALRIRKEQDANDPDLARNRPATTLIVYDAIKTRMDEALARVRNGLDEGEDAPDIIANTFLSEVTPGQLDRIGLGFLAHPHLRLAIFGHLAWVAQHASGNRGDDFRAPKLCELQPYTITHPNGRTTIPSILGLQGEEKAGKRGMRTVINPVYSAFIAHANPEMCPLGAFAFYFHYLHDVKQLATTMDIDWALNKSWRQVRVLHGAKAATVPFNEQSLYNLYCRAYKAAGFNSRLKAHLPRHLLGYKQAEMNVDASETSKMGWVRGQTYHDTYAPALPRKAILGAAGYRADEPYDPVWRHVRVPEKFLALMCPMAEEIYKTVVDRANLSGAANHWAMIQELRPYLFQCGAALFQKCPDSAIFKLPALADPDVQNWMKNEFPNQLTLLGASSGNPVDLTRIQNDFLRSALEELRGISSEQKIELKKLRELLERRTAVLSPAQGFSAAVYHRNGKSLICCNGVVLIVSFIAVGSSPHDFPAASRITVHLDENSDATGTYETEDDSTLRAFANPSPRSPDTPRATSQVDLILPPTAAFYDPSSIFPPQLGQKSVQWPEVFECIKRPQLCWDVWGPKKTLEQFESIQDIWSAYAVGEPVFNSAGVQTGVKPPLQLVEKYFHSAWRTSDNDQHWSRFREIPEWVAASSDRRHVSPSIIIDELEGMRVEGSPTATAPVPSASPASSSNRASSAPSLPSSSDHASNAPSLPLFPSSSNLDSYQGAAAAAPTIASTSSLGPAFVLQPASETMIQKKKRLPPIGARRAPAKKLKT